MAHTNSLNETALMDLKPPRYRSFIEFLWKNPDTWQYMKYDVIHFFLAFCYAAVLVISVFMLFRYYYNSKAFVFTFIAGTSLRFLFFLAQPFIREQVFLVANAINFIMSTLPSFLYFSTYIMMLFFWGEIFRTNESFRRRALTRRIYLVFLLLNGLMYAVIFGLYLLDLLQISKSGNSPAATPITPYEKGVQVFASSMYVIVSVGFFVYAYFTFRFAYMKQDNAVLVHTQERRRLLRRVGTITLFCMGAFLVRGALTLWSMFDPKVDLWWWLDGAYYFFLEVIPVTSMLFVYVKPRKEKKKKKKKKKKDTDSHDSDSHDDKDETVSLVD